MGKKRSKQSKWLAPKRDLNAAAIMGVRMSETGPDGEPYQVQHVRGGTKAYRCPGCDQEIALGTPHVVVWPEDGAALWDRGVNARRHWHPHCWKRKLKPS